MRNTCVALLGLALFVSRAYGFDITTCGQVVPDGETGVLTVDLDCSALHGQASVIVGNRGTLSLDGHSITTASDSESVFCDNSRLCTVVGPGTLSGGRGISAAKAIKVSNLTIRDAMYGVSAIARVVASDLAIDTIAGDGITGARLDLTRVTVTDCDNTGVSASRSLRATDLVVNNSGSTGVHSGGHYRIDGLTALNNGRIPPRGGGGLLAVRSGRLSNATLTGNTYTDPFIAQYAADILVRRPVKVDNVTCDHSVRYTSIREPGTPLGYCAGD